MKIHIDRVQAGLMQVYDSLQLLYQSFELWVLDTTAVVTSAAPCTFLGCLIACIITRKLHPIFGTVPHCHYSCSPLLHYHGKCNTWAPC